MPITYESIPDEGSSFLRNKGESFPSSSPWLEPFGRLSVSRKTAVLAGACCGLLVLLGSLSGSATSYLPSFLLGTRGGANTIEICVFEMIKIERQISRNANVKCWDKDPNGDDLMAEGFTGSDGCVTLDYLKAAWDGIGGRSPDIYCMVEKAGFVVATPPDKDHHDQSKVAKMDDVTLFRDRRGDSGHVNGCGPYFTEVLGVNYLAAWATRFGDQCFHHDKCYWDCQIFLASNNAAEAQEFCDKEMYEGMKSVCHAHRGQLPGVGEDSCLELAKSIYQGLKILGSTLAYDKSDEICPSNGNKIDDSMNNDYSHPSCFLQGYHCGYDGSIGDDLGRCNNCCDNKRAVDEGYTYDDHYCKCFPSGHKCGTTLFYESFNKCSDCCRGHRKDDGWSYDDYFCT